MTTEYIQVLTTIDSRQKAAAIAQTLLQQRLAGCVQILGPVQSHYWWQGRSEQSEEWLCVAKTRQDLYPAVEEVVRQIHSYQVPEILAVPILAGLGAYLAWLDQELRPPEKPSSDQVQG